MPPDIRPYRWPQALLALVAAITLTALPQTAVPAAAVVVRQEEWPLDAQHFDADSIWRLAQGQGVTVAVIDSGVDATHPDLAGQVLSGTGFIGDPKDTGQSDISSDSHGTAIAGIIAGTGTAQGGSGMIGLAPRAKLLPVRVGAQGAVTALALAQGIKYAADHHAQVINVSLGTPTPDPLLREAVAYALGKDAVLVASAGNSGQDGNPLLYPAAFPGVIDVTGTDAQGQFWPVSESGPHTTLAAPSTRIYSTNSHGQYVQAEGTSYGAAYVSAAAALVRSTSPRLTASQTIRRLITTAQHPSGHALPDDQYGYGIVAPLAALKDASTTASNTNPLLSAPISAGQADAHSDTIVIVAAGGLAAATAVTSAFIWRRRARSRGNQRRAQPTTPQHPPAKRKKNGRSNSSASHPTRSRSR
ncbi:S8 family serine peptidase [Streptomyces violascens]|uniref:S8 family serine peptidase n=1 Tax=Streptomyces violascens TaxID=67381 RepID=UPI003676E2FC